MNKDLYFYIGNTITENGKVLIKRHSLVRASKALYDDKLVIVIKANPDLLLYEDYFTPALPIFGYLTAVIALLFMLYLKFK